MEILSSYCEVFGIAPCMTPTGSFWVEHLCRPLFGAEALRLQGLYLAEIDEYYYSSGFLEDLAGNAVHSMVGSMAWMVLIVLSGRLHNSVLDRKLGSILVSRIY